MSSISPVIVYLASTFNIDPPFTAKEALAALPLMIFTVVDDVVSGKEWLTIALFRPDHRTLSIRGL